MARILISFLGTGGVITKNNDTAPEHDKEPRQYRRANYYLNGKCLGGYTFVSLALRKEFNADKAIMIGTVRSMWEEVYLNLKQSSSPDYQPTDDPVYFDIAEHCDRSSHQSELELPHQDEIEKALGQDSHVVLIKYGLNDDEIQENINRILSLEQYIHNGDELIIDITHSFRSLPILITQLLLYLKTISNKKITISHVFYGMLDITKEMGNKTPIVDLASIININDWIIGAYALKNYGNGSKIAELVESEDKSVSNLIRDFSNAMNLNHILAIQSQVQRLSGIKNKTYRSRIPEMIIPSTIEGFVKEFSNITRHSVFELKLAEWQAKHHNYTAAYISLIESIVTYVCELNDLDDSDFDEREHAKDIIRGKCSGKCDQVVSQNFWKYNRKRNSLAHSIESTESLISMITDLNDGIKLFKTIIK